MENRTHGRRRSARWPLPLALTWACTLGACATGVVGSGAELLSLNRARSPDDPVSACRRDPDHQEAVRWIMPRRPGDAVALGAWCAGVGPALVASGGEPTGGAGAVVHVVSWNVHVGGGDVLALVDDLRSGALTEGKPVGDFVLLLQEVHRSGPSVPPLDPGAAFPSTIRESPPMGERVDVAEIAHRLGLHLLYVPSMRNGGADPSLTAEDRGNAILSTLPLSAPTAIELPYEAQRRVAVAATVSVGDGGAAPHPLVLVSGHLDTRSRPSRLLDSFGAGRTRQARALADALPEGAVVLGADLNTWSLGFLEGASSVLRERLPTRASGDLEPTYVAAGVIPRRLDHLLFRLPDGWSALVERIDDRYGSDHYPLVATVRAPDRRSAVRD